MRLKLLTGVTALSERKIYCLSNSQHFLPYEVGKLYVNRYFGKNAKQNVCEIALFLRKKNFQYIS